MSEEKTPQVPTPTPEENSPMEAKDVTLLGGSPLGKWWDNFWYHYKFQFLAGLLALVIVTVCVVQCVRRPDDADITLCYAGPANLQATSATDPTLSIEGAILKSLQAYAGEDTETRFALTDYLIDRENTDPTVQNYTAQNISALRDELMVANAFLYLMDEELYLEYAASDTTTHYMCPVTDYLPETPDANIRITADGRGVYLSSTPLYTLDGFRELPEDTVLCLRLSYSLSQKKSQNAWEQARDLLKRVFD